jgi:hypothetical protein
VDGIAVGKTAAASVLDAPGPSGGRPLDLRPRAPPSYSRQLSPSNRNRCATRITRQFRRAPDLAVPRQRCYLLVGSYSPWRTPYAGALSETAAGELHELAALRRAAHLTRTRLGAINQAGGSTRCTRGCPALAPRQQESGNRETEGGHSGSGQQDLHGGGARLPAGSQPS